MRRLGLVETGLLIASQCDFEAKKARAEAGRHTRNLLAGLMSDVTVTDEAAHRAAVARAEQAEARKDEEVPRMGRAFLVK